MKKGKSALSTNGQSEKANSGLASFQNVQHLPSTASAIEPESMRKLRALKEKISNELQQEQKERVEFETRDVVVPLSLASDYAGTSKKTAKASKQQMEKLVNITKEKISGLKQLDKHTQRDLEIELEKKATEMTQLKAHNQRLREIITLRQESNIRREETFENEVQRVKLLTDETCVDARNYHATMQELRDMNQQVQDGAVQMKTHIEEQAEAERLALIRTYRVRMREVKQQLKVQEAANLEGASAWIRRYNILDADKQTAEANLKNLKQKIELLTTDNSELRVMKKHQDEQRNTLAQKIAVLKRENTRFEEHIAKLEGQLIVEEEKPSNSNGSGGAVGTPVRLLQSRGSSRSGNRHHLSLDDPVQKRQRLALDKIKTLLSEMRTSLGKVRTAHVELLQERTELEMFIRQCIEDVRRDMYRFTVVSNISRSMNGDRWEEKALLEDYGVKERKRLLDILNSKLQVLTLLHQRMFPGKQISGDQELGDYFKKLQKSADGSNDDDVIKSTIQAVPINHEVDDLWNRWKEWTRSVTPS